MRLNLGTKLAILTAAIILFVGASLGIYFIQHESTVLWQEMDDRADLLLDSLGVSCEYPILTRHLDSLNKIVDNAMKQKDVVYCRITDSHDAILAESGMPSATSMREFSLPVLYERGGYAEGEDVIFGAATNEEMAREKVGTVRLGMSTEGIARRLWVVKKTVAILVIFVILVASIIVLLIFRRAIIKPIGILVAATGRIAKGDMGFKVPLKEDDGTLGQLAAAFNKMTTDLQEVTVSKSYVDSIIQSMADALIVTGPDAHIWKVNRAALELLQYEQKDLIGKTIGAIWKLPMEGVSQSFKNREGFLVRRDGERVTVNFSATPMLDDDGKVTGSVYLAHDLTERKRIEAMMLRSDKMSAVGQLAAGVAHEINNPLGIILGFAQGLVRRMAPGDPHSMPLQSIEREALRCKNLVQDLLTFSRTPHLDREPIDLNKAIEGALSLVQAQARMGKAELVKELRTDIPMILANNNQIQQVIINLASNALDAMPNGGTLTVKTELTEDFPVSWVCLTIADTGEGIPADLVSKIFEPFFTTKPVGQGTGLGLSLVHEIVARHSGTIEVQSRPGSTKFCVKFPARNDNEIRDRMSTLHQMIHAGDTNPGIRKG